MLVTIRDGKCVVSGENHYPGYGPVSTMRGRHVTVLGAPRLYGSPSGGASNDAVSSHEPESAATATVIGRLLQLPDVRCWGDALNGHFLIVIDDPVAGACTIVTDIGNSFHCFEYLDATNGSVTFGTNIDEVARTSGQHDVDIVSLAEYLVHMSMTYPRTAYEHIVEMPYASWITIGYRHASLAVARGQYWQPTCPESCDATIDELAHALRRGIFDAVDACTRGKRNVALLLSGGMDSRAIAGILAHLNVRATALTMADTENSETRIARAVAEACGFSHELWLRDREFYPRLLDDFVALEGPHATFTRATHFGFRDRIRARGFDAVIGGYMSDTLLKLHEANVRGRYFFGRHLGMLESFDPTDIAHLRGGSRERERFHGIIRCEVLDAVGARRDALLAWWNDHRRDGSAWEWSWMWPFMRNQHNANLTTNIFSYPAYEVFTDRAVLEIARLAPQRWKLNGRLFNRAMAPVLRITAHLPIAVTNMRWFQPQWAYETAVAAWHVLPRRWTFREHSGRTSATQGSWPNLATLWETSPMLTRLRAAHTASRIQRTLMLSSKLDCFDARKYRALSLPQARHLMYTMLHYGRWERRIALRTGTSVVQ